MMTLKEIEDLIQKHCQTPRPVDNFEVYDIYQPRPRLNFEGLGDLSIQVGINYYCSPRLEEAPYYTSVEVGYPSIPFSEQFISQESDEGEGVIFPEVTIKRLALEIFSLYQQKENR